MTPKEKAEKIFDKYQTLNYEWDGAISKGWAKEGALIAVDEILELLAKDVNPLVNYWFEVKQEIYNYERTNL